MHHVVAKAPWDDAAMLAAVRGQVIPALERHGPIGYWIVDDSGMPKQGKHSVGVARQYCGNLGKRDSCQVAVSLSVANDHASLPIAYQLYLPQDWAADQTRRQAAGVPERASPSPPSRRSRSGRSARLWPTACRSASCWATPAMGWA